MGAAGKNSRWFNRVTRGEETDSWPEQNVVPDCDWTDIEDDAVKVRIKIVADQNIGAIIAAEGRLGSLINPGVTIGNASIIGAGAVVTRDIPDHVIAAGNPCRVVRPVTGEDRAKWEEMAAQYQSGEV